MEYLSDMFLMFFGVVQVYEDVIEINDNMDVKHVTETVIHEPLESCWSICEAKRHNHPFEGSVMCLESCLPFNTFSNADQVISMLEI